MKRRSRPIGNRPANASRPRIRFWSGCRCTTRTCDSSSIRWASIWIWGRIIGRSINEALRRFQSDFFGPGKSIVVGVRETIGGRFLGDSELKTLPESWLYWPITAGGLSLRNLTVLAGQFNEVFSERQKKRIAPPANRAGDWQFSKEWNAYYAQFFTALKPKGPKETPVMKTLLDDFIKRGSEVSAGKQKTLSEYWRWVLVVYGPEILEKFGTFRFLITDLVPLQLIHERLLNDDSLSES